MNQTLAQLTLPGPGGPIKVQNPSGFVFTGADANLGAIVSRATLFIFAFAGIGLLLMLIFGGFDYLTSAGDTKKLEQGQQKITYAIIGFLIIFAAFWIVQIVGVVFGLDTVIGNIFK